MDKKTIQQFIINALQEDIGEGDHTSLSTIPSSAIGKAKLLVKDEGIIAGVSLAKDIFYAVDSKLKVDVLIQDGGVIKYGDIAFYVEGSARSILAAERLVLNAMQRMSGIATTTNQIVQKLSSTNTKVLDTRKTTPNIRFLEKWAVKIGGGVNHRFGLYDMILIKDNHVDYAGGIAKAINAAKTYLADNHKNIQIEIEVRNEAELLEVLNIGGVDRILLDNFNFDQLKKAVAIVNKRFTTEASGGITPENALQYAECGVDFISMGALTHSVRSLDMSLKAVI